MPCPVVPFEINVCYQILMFQPINLANSVIIPYEESNIKFSSVLQSIRHSHFAQFQWLTLVVCIFISLHIDTNSYYRSYQ